jgi:hypothetical protein
VIAGNSYVSEVACLSDLLRIVPSSHVRRQLWASAVPRFPAQNCQAAIAQGGSTITRNLDGILPQTKLVALRRQ